MVHAFVDNRELPLRPIDENQWDLHQLFFDIRPLGEEIPLTLRIGRQELSYGQERFVSPLDWVNTRRRFDAVKLFWKAGDWSFDVWYAKPVPPETYSFDDFDEEYDFYGGYFTYLGIPGHGIDLFFFAQDITADSTNPNGNAGDISRFTLGGRAWGKTGPVDYEGVLAGQWGRWAGDTIQGWAWTLAGGYTLEQVPWTPRIGTGLDWASGDEHSGDGKVGTFDQVFPLAHKYLGWLDLFSRQNVTAANVNLSFWPVKKKVRAAIVYHAFWLNAEEDFLYNVAGGPGRRDPAGESGKALGSELDLALLWNVDVHSSLLLGWSHFWPSNFIEATGPSEDADFFYVQYRFKF
jgi:hypothetical protein